MSKIPKGEKLLTAWKEAKGQGATRKQFADELGITAKSLDNRLYRAKHKSKPKKYINDKVDGNYRTITAQVRHRSVDDLLKHLNVDLTEWRIDDRYEVGSWEMGRRAEDKKLVWAGGKIDYGYANDYGDLFINTLHRFKVPLVRINPIPITPVVSPVRITVNAVLDEHERNYGPGMCLQIPDIQMGYRRNFRTGDLTPFHDRRAIGVVLQVMHDYEFEQINILGDFADFTEWTDRFVREPEFYQTTQPMVIEGHWLLTQIRALQPNARIVFIAGNHEDRIERQMMEHMRAAYKLKPATELHLDEPLGIDRLFGLTELDIELVGDYPNGQCWYGENSKSIHGNRFSSKAGGTVSSVIQNMLITTTFGHGHKIEMATKTIEDAHGNRRYVTAAMLGCLCHIDYRVPGHKRGQNWQQGFGIIHHHKISPRVEPVPIVDGEAIFNGVTYAGNDYVQRLNNDVKDTGWSY